MPSLFSASLSLPEIAAYAAVVLNIAVYWMRTMVPLRVFAIAVNVLFIVYSSAELIYPTLVLNSILLPLNLYRLYEMLLLTRKVKAASEAGFDFNWLRPFTSRHTFAKGETVFRRGDVADAMYVIVSGKFFLAESGIVLNPGTVVGEMGLVAPDGLRSQTLVSEEVGEALSVTYARFKEIYFQNPAFGFYFLKLVTQRLFENNRALEEKLLVRKTQPS
jgi:hypothetical protein